MSRSGKNEIESLLRVLDEKGRDLSIDDIVQNPISCGYLLDFCQKQYCAENLNFFVAGGLTCKNLADRIWADFLSTNSPCEVSLPSEDRLITMERLKFPGVYRQNLFEVAVKDAVKTLQKDTLGRFLKSPQFTDMETIFRAVLERMNTGAVEDTAFDSDLPTKIALTEARINLSSEYTLDEILDDKILFREMLEYLENKFKAENLKCTHHILRFEHLADQKIGDDLKVYAWNIYLYYLAPGSPYEVSCTALDRKFAQLRLGCPERSMFHPIKESTLAVLKQDVKPFCSQLVQKDLKEKLEKELPPTNRKKASFFSKVRVF
uniref:Uncharacterized protein AlNc14C8G1118 n=1 Tax=Albugo laibachii Nc14 TaxID=890382 RepID=F0W244_9STRA|nr:cleavage induced hypothetical protein [Albugo laibachii Nc14]|eukprot:CCA15124.1 cleavage induced hypothetical protein [Albugo laibachii Nc14]